MKIEINLKDPDVVKQFDRVIHQKIDELVSEDLTNRFDKIANKKIERIEKSNLQEKIDHEFKKWFEPTGGYGKSQVQRMIEEAVKEEVVREVRGKIKIGQTI